jgi:uncharacterized UPF0160 family protein
MEKKILIVTHNGRFHTDELLAAATLSLHLGDTPHEIVRSRDPKVWETADFLVDVGGEYDPSRGRFDHHQTGGAGERNGIAYSSFGAVWKEFGVLLSKSTSVAEAIERKLAYPVDATDNGMDIYRALRPDIHPYGLHQFVVAWNSTWKEGDKQAERFLELVGFFKRMLEREIASVRDTEEGEAITRKLYHEAADKRVIIMDDQYPNDPLAEFPEPLFVVKPARQNTFWEVECVRNDIHSFKNRKDIPEEWAGKMGEELASVTGVPDAIFAHLKRFIAVARSKEGALRLAEMARDA